MRNQGGRELSARLLRAKRKARKLGTIKDLSLLSNHGSHYHKPNHSKPKSHCESGQTPLVLGCRFPPSSESVAAARHLEPLPAGERIDILRFKVWSFF